MEYKARNGESYELADLTLALSETFEAAKTSKTIEDRCKGMFEAVEKSVGKDAAKEILGTSSYKSVSMPKLAIEFHAIDNAYWGEYREKQRDEMMAHLEDYKEVIEQASKLAMIKEKVSSRQGFRNVK